MSHPIPQEVEEKLKQLTTKLTEMDVFWVDGTKDYWNIENNIDACDAIEQALLSVYNSGRRDGLQGLEDEVQTMLDGPFAQAVYSWSPSDWFLTIQRHIKSLSAPSSEDNA